MLVKNFGHFWERKFINYGAGGKGNRGHLKGYVTAKKVANFREQMGIYVLFDKDFLPIYVGQAGSGKKGLWQRLNQHEKDHLWNRWEYFSWLGFRRVNKNGSLSAFDDVEKVFKAKGSMLLNEIEGALITVLEPKLNKQGASWKDVTEYYQTIDDEMRELTSGDLAEKLDDLKRHFQVTVKKTGAK